MFITVMSKIIYNISLEHGTIHRAWSSKTLFCRKINHRCFFLMLKDVCPQCYVQNVWSRKWKIVPTSPPVASTEPSWLNAKANCCPTCCNWVSSLSECFTPSLWTPSLFSFSQSNHLDKKCIRLICTRASYCWWWLLQLRWIKGPAAFRKGANETVTSRVNRHSIRQIRGCVQLSHLKIKSSARCIHYI